MTIEQRVTRGIELLDSRVPGWDKLIVLSTLELESTRQCVLGQLYLKDFNASRRAVSPYDLGKCALGLTKVGEASDHGFSVAPFLDSTIFGLTHNPMSIEYQQLNAEWRCRIEARRIMREAASAPPVEVPEPVEEPELLEV